MGHLRSVLVRISGVVQGIGFRPAIYAIATRCPLAGEIHNSPTGVDIRLQGPDRAVTGAIAAIRELHLPGLRYDSILVEEAVPDSRLTGFVIAPSAVTNVGLEVPADAAICDACRQDIRAPGRYQLYPLTACTACGPRLTVIDRLPYQRGFTTVAPFRRCRHCVKSYCDPADRRFNFETNTCWHCAPWMGAYERRANRLTAVGGPCRLEADLAGPDSGLLTPARLSRLAKGPAAMDVMIRRLREYLATGGTVMIKGVGGYQLVADACSDSAVARLRELKQRPSKPFAVMMPSLEVARAHAVVSDHDAGLLGSRQAPVVIVPALDDSVIAPSVRGGRKTLGVFLPYSALHLLLVDRPLVVTSANLADEPIMVDDLAAFARFGLLVDMTFLHERAITVGIDDSVVMGGGRDGEIMIRRARGYAPASIKAHPAARAVLAVGADTKSAFALARDGRLFASPHLGDLADGSARERFRQCLAYYERALDVRFDIVVSDLHPGYVSTALADQLAGERDVQRLSVQHHHAHALSVMAEHGLSEAVAIVCDGTGWGTDGTIWGGEILHVRPDRFERLTGLATYPLLGGEAAARDHLPLLAVAEPQLDVAFRERRGSAFSESWLGKHVLADRKYADQRPLLRQLVDRNLTVLDTSSAGRLFDLAAALFLGRHHSDYEADAAMSLEEAAWSALPGGLAAQALTSPDEAMLDVLLERSSPSRASSPGRTAIPGLTLLANAACLADELTDLSLGALAFHVLLADAMAVQAGSAMRERKVSSLVLSGGCAQNRLFRLLIRRSLRAYGTHVYENSRFPPNDGNICVGQAFSAAQPWKPA